MVKSRTDWRRFNSPSHRTTRRSINSWTRCGRCGPTGIIGVSTVPKLFNQQVIEAMPRSTSDPLSFPYSNPTSRSECTADEAYRWSSGRPSSRAAVRFRPSKLAARPSCPDKATTSTSFRLWVWRSTPPKRRASPRRCFIVAAKAVAEQVSDASLATGLIYPPQSQIFEASLHVAIGVAEYIFEKGLARVQRPKDIAALIRASCIVLSNPS